LKKAAGFERIVESHRMETVGIYEMRTRLAELVDKVVNGEEVTVTRHGIPVAKIVPIDTTSKVPVRDAIEAMKKFGRGKSLRGLTIKKMIEQGRM
jgi:prevent-host-death family protein